MEGYHSSVLCKEIVDALKVAGDKWYLDATLGDGGHSAEILKRGGNVIGIDVDPQALERAKERLGKLGNSEKLGELKLVKGNFRDLKNLLQSASPKGGRDKQTDTAGLKFVGAKSNLAGAIFDLGVSSLQLENPERGFSFTNSGPIDMRMDPNLEVKALDLIYVLSRKELNELFKKFGEETNSWRLATALVRTRQVKPFTNTIELANFIERVLGKKGKIHPATKVFQALRIAVNDELGALSDGLEQVKEMVLESGCICVISFHSLEDRIVKDTFRLWETQGIGKVLTKKPVIPGEDEINKNSRSRSAKLRVFKKL